MSFKERKKVIQEGDTVILYLGKQSLVAINVDSSKTHQTKFGSFPHKDIIGKEFGMKHFSKNNRGFIYLLHPTPELWTVTLPHRTQILYTTDISLITQELELRPGSVVVESGTGSGSLSHAIIRSVKPNGHLYTFDFHQQRVEKAREEFELHGIGEYVTCGHADACQDGFSMEDKADANLPGPWNAIPHAKKALKKSGGRLCSFSPCIEQVQSTCDVLRKHRFCEIKTVECLLQPKNVRTVPIPEVNLGPESLTRQTDVTNEAVGCEPDSKKIKIEDDVNDEIKAKDKTETNVNVERLTETGQKNDDINQISGMDSKGMVTKLIAKPKPGNVNVLTSKTIKEVPGHTGYLTFATLYPYQIVIKEE